MLTATAIAIVLMSGQEPTVIGNAARSRPAARRDAAAGPAPGGEAKPTEEVCRDVPVTGSRFPRRVCETREQAVAEREEGRSMLRRMQGSRVPDGR